MEDKIEVEEYVRSKDGYIGKIEKIMESKRESLNYYICEKNNAFASNYRDNIVKHSKNIIDLIEQGDYVNNMLVTEVGKNEKAINICFYNGLYAENLKLFESDIKSIVTKELFEQVKYKVGE